MVGNVATYQYNTFGNLTPYSPFCLTADSFNIYDRRTGNGVFRFSRDDGFVDEGAMTGFAKFEYQKTFDTPNDFSPEASWRYNPATKSLSISPSFSEIVRRDEYPAFVAMHHLKG
jgi:hypothetical protein